MSLLGLILEELEYERLLEEGKDPVEVLHYKYQNIPSNIIDAVIAIDPTKKKSYSQWALSKWDNEKNTILNSLKNGKLKELFQHYREHQDIQIKDCPSIEEGLRFVSDKDSVLDKSTEPTTYIENLGEDVDSDLANDFDIVFNEDDWIIAVPNTYEAECKLGENMKWCTANAFGNGESYYDDYLRRGGKYYVNFDLSRGESRNGKDYPYTRYQFHFETQQFKDKEDDDVTLGEIDMPESAIEFYESEGYDRSDFEDIETKMERYDEERWATNYRINDELALNIAYDDDLEFIEPNENTDFYVFDENDDRDPISWLDICNPHTDDGVIIKNTPNYVILKPSVGEDKTSVLVIKSTEGNNRYREWSMHRISNYIELPHNYGIFARVSANYYGNNNHYCYFPFGGQYTEYEQLMVRECDGIFINEACTEATEKSLYIETVQGEYHSLFMVSYDDELECIIKKDRPQNGSYYTINENGIIETAFGRYKADPYGEYNDNDNISQYSLDREVSNGDYIVSMDVRTDSGGFKEEYNILRPGTNNLLLDDWADSIGFECGLYYVEKQKMYAFYDVSGNQIGKWYTKISGLNKDKGVFVGKIGNKECDIISGPKESVIATFSYMMTSSPVNNKIVAIANDNKAVCYDIVEEKLCHTEFETMQQISTYSNRYFYCKMANSDEYVILDLLNDNNVVSGIKNASPINRNTIKIEKLNGKFNVFGAVENTERYIYETFLPIDVDYIYDVKNDYSLRCALFKLNERCYAYDFAQKRYLVNPNGFDINDNISIYLDNALCFSDGKYCIYYYPDKDYMKWSPNNDDWYRYRITEPNTPQEVRNIYNKIVPGGSEIQQNQSTEAQQNAVAENFKRILKKLNEARKLMRD